MPQLKEILETFSLLKEVNTKGVKPSFHPVEMKDVMRDDKERGCLSQKEALSLAPHKKNGYFMGPKVVE